MIEKSLVPQQERSRQTLECLLRATIKALDEGGLDQATIPRIAEAAGVAPASVYRRFADKDALIRTALLSVIESSGAAIKQSLDPSSFASKSIEPASRALIGTIFSQYRQHPKLLAAVKQFGEREEEHEFAETATKIFAANLGRMVAALLACKGIPKGRNREVKVRFGLMTVVSAIEVMCFEPSSLWHVCQEESPVKVQERLGDMLLAYLLA